MATTEAAAKIVDLVVVELVECVPEPEPVLSVALPDMPEASPITDASTATIEQTGAEPPPGVSRG